MAMWPFAGRRPLRLAAVYLAPAAGTPMRLAERAEALVGRGLCGDRYAARAGFWQATDACQLTLIGTRDLARARRRAPKALRPALDAGSHRRNLVVSPVHARALLGKRLRIGGAVLVCRKPRPPCGYLDRVAGSGLCRALGRDSGICLEVVEGGWLAPGDAVEVLPG
ncbi:MOSC domain-containing protein [Acidihalobacter prosperus]|uniref:MOSC domain-containing protein n=1 Tax=Acidihalobacter prosperus TaxID=160660 RepID=A0A1A6C0U2_9GAMM|nr:MOSC domain-containing protein [Acidihalobacter prosperus]OBS08169.1 MOSC domain-containing protein [Acidihalobacter prosperus]